MHEHIPAKCDEHIPDIPEVLIETRQVVPPANEVNLPHSTADGVAEEERCELCVQLITVSGSPRPGPTLIFLHDSLGCIDTWRDFPLALVMRLRLNAMIYDRPGHGRSSPMSDRFRTPRYLHREMNGLFQLLEALAIDEVILFGHSDGGSIALLAAAEQPSRVCAVLTEGAHVFVEERTLEGIRAARTLFRQPDQRARLERYHGEKTDRLLSAWIDTWLSPLYRHWRIEDELAGSACPALIMQGQDDEYGTPAQVHAIVEKWGGQAGPLLFPGVGHSPHREIREAVLDASVRFVESAIA